MPTTPTIRAAKVKRGGIGKSTDIQKAWGVATVWAMTAIFVTADRIVALVDCPDIDDQPPAPYVFRFLPCEKPATLARKLEARRYYRTPETVDGLPVYKEG